MCDRNAKATDGGSSGEDCRVPGDAIEGSRHGSPLVRF
jgi:hypothetical protein